MDIQDVINYVNETPNNTNPAVLKGMVEAIVEDSESGESGGGSSDFSIAHITFINTAQNSRYYTVKCPNIFEGYMEFHEENVTTIAPRTIDVILYKGEQYVEAWEWDTSIAPVIVGDITYNSENEGFIITGDGSISLVGIGQTM